MMSERSEAQRLNDQRDLMHRYPSETVYANEGMICPVCPVGWLTERMVVDQYRMICPKCGYAMKVER